MAEQNPALKKYRDGLETVTNKVMDHVHGASHHPHRHQQPTPSEGGTGNEAQPGIQFQDSVSTPVSASASTLDEMSSPGLGLGMGMGFGDWLDTMQFPTPGLVDASSSIPTGSQDLSFNGLLTEDFWAGGDPFVLPMLNGME